MCRALFNRSHPHATAVLNNLGLACAKLGQHQQALECYQSALQLSLRLFDGPHPDIAASLSNVGAAYDSLRRHQEALEYCKCALH